MCTGRCSEGHARGHPFVSCTTRGLLVALGPHPQTLFSSWMHHFTSVVAKITCLSPFDAKTLPTPPPRWPIVHRCNKVRESPKKRGAYRKHRGQGATKVDWLDLFKRLEKWQHEKGREKGSYTAIASDLTANPQRVKRRTLANRYVKWVKSGKPEVFDNTERRGGSNRAFTIEEEREMALEVQGVYLDEAQGWNGEDFHLLALEKWNSQIRNCTRSAGKFKASSWFVWRFKKAWGFRSKVPQISRIAKNPDLKSQIEVYLRLCSYWRNVVEDRDFWIFDETFWRIVMGCLVSWGRAKIPARIKHQADVKRGVTLGFAFNLAGGRLPVQVLRKGSTAKALTALQLDRLCGVRCFFCASECIVACKMKAIQTPVPWQLETSGGK